MRKHTLVPRPDPVKLEEAAKEKIAAHRLFAILRLVVHKDLLPDEMKVYVESMTDRQVVLVIDRNRVAVELRPDTNEDLDTPWEFQEAVQELEQKLAERERKETARIKAKEALKGLTPQEISDAGISTWVLR